MAQTKTRGAAMTRRKPSIEDQLAAERDELIAFMQKAVSERDTVLGDDPGLTSEEWGKVWGVGEHRGQQRLQELAKAGLLIVGRRNSVSITGTRIRIPVYRAK